MEQGVVKWFNDSKGYGFIEKNEGGDIFVHHTGIISEGFKTLQEDQKVEFEVENTPKGPRAVSVRTI